MKEHLSLNTSPINKNESKIRSTGISHFKYHREEYIETAAIVSKMEDKKNRYMSFGRKVNELEQKYRQTMNSRIDYHKELLNTEGYLKSSISVSQKYLDLYSELKKLGAHEEEVFIIFKKVIAINLGLSKYYNQYRHRYRNKEEFDDLLAKQHDLLVNQHFTLETSPLWYKTTNKTNWKKYIDELCYMPLLSDPQLLTPTERNEKPNNNDVLRMLLLPDEDAFPDWFNNNEPAPTIDTVKSEAESDRLSLATISQQADEYHQQTSELDRYYTNQLNASIQWIREQQKDLPINTFTGVIEVLNFNNQSLNQVFSSGSIIHFGYKNSNEINIEKEQQSIIRQEAHQANFLTSPESTKMVN